MVSSDYYVNDSSTIEERNLLIAKEQYQQGKYSEALKIYLGMLNTSMSYELYLEIGKCYYKLNDFMKAEEYLKKSLSLEDGYNQSYLFLGNIYFKRNRTDEAIEYWSEAFARYPDEEAVCLNLATSYFSKKMKFQSFYYYERYLKYAKVANDSYNTIKSSIDKCYEAGNEFYEKGKRANSNNNKDEAIEYLTYATKHIPTSFDINHLLGKIYLEKQDYMHALIYLKQAFCIDFRSLDVLQELSQVYVSLGDYTATYCTLRRLLPLVMHNQKEYLNTMRLIQELKQTFDKYSYQGHLEWGKNYDREKNYHMALIEYENSLILQDNIQEDTINSRIAKLKTFISPESRIIKSCIERGSDSFKNKDFKTSNHYFSRVMRMADKHTSEYKMAKSRVTNV